MNREEYIAQAHMIEQQTIEIKPIKTDGFILDIGGGGEGIIGKLNGTQVAAIDKRPQELEETHNDALKIVMDATDLKFLDNTFTAATALEPPSAVTTAELCRIVLSGGALTSSTRQ